jgi:hypothetical protein
MHVPNFIQVLLEGTIYDLFKSLFWAALMTGAVQLIFQRAFHLINERREIIALWIGGVVLFSALIYSLGARPQQPMFEAAIQQAFTGPLPGNARDTIAVVNLNIINAGTMQSIVKSWRVRATAGGSSYEGTFVQMPPTFTFNNIPKTVLNQPTSITFHSEDNIVEKATKPIEIGSMLAGILFIEFSNVDQSVFRGPLAFDVMFQDVLSREYIVSLKGNGQIGAVANMPGTHTEMACPVPPGGLPKMETNPLAVPTPN